MMVRLAIWYRTLMVLLVPVTFGIGTLVLWLYARQWPKRVDANGILDRRGRSIPWKSIQQIGALRTGWDGSHRTKRLDIDYRGGHSRIHPRTLRHGQEVARSIIEHFEQSRPRPPHPEGGWKRAARASDLPNPMIAAAEVG